VSGRSTLQNALSCPAEAVEVGETLTIVGVCFGSGGDEDWEHPKPPPTVSSAMRSNCSVTSLLIASLSYSQASGLAKSLPDRRT
jgi:hypothetical protein